ncbi:hypothetical protein COV81_00995 [Candidatus Peregrinibacteria bacterium CG11_big_fil_rev_8_21_14_0_20_41_10]|nr:MAG: hypothetical protein COV81_00995 [Candidatus Peregrinibacteria bacterium CG11_big_fil_rev_8_21_14_0_20_41_10]PIZ76131.1 MAG: hypothetical protein COY06_02285 [Candidatus Peregrinibacteria bacterium CG_4_10_14_0_2_um_filter_41_8]PJC38121.1 MAG: hypothetical protein CO045_01930 [Candidatus Peregrinibacteria bacterium CG_4_9_14_0_2_um_filter_41_14]
MGELGSRTIDELPPVDDGFERILVADADDDADDDDDPDFVVPSMRDAMDRIFSDNTDSALPWWKY